MRTAIPMIGKKFGRLTVIQRAGAVPGGCALYICECECGNITHPIKGTNLRNGDTQSCGCLAKEVAKKTHTTHGKTNTRLFNIWSGMRERCNNPNCRAFKDYGGRGIKICPEWEHDFQTFYEWAMSNGYADNLTIDRKDNEKGYSPDNCRWTTTAEQNRNRRNCKSVKLGRAVSA